VQVNTDAGEARLGGELPPRVALRARPSGPPEIIVLWTARAATTAIKIARSLDGGASFSPAVTLQEHDAPGDRGWPALTVDASGTAHAVWLDHRGLVTGAGAAGHDHKSAIDGAVIAQRSGLFYAQARADAAAAPNRQLAAGVCYCCKTALVAGPDGALYAAWRHVYPGNLRDIAFSVSRDGGRTFAAPVRVSADGWHLNGCPDDGPAMAVDANGTLHLVWPTVLQGREPGGALFYASTRDGRTFTPRMRVPTFGTPKPSHPQVAVDARGVLTIAWDEVVKGTRVPLLRQASRAPGSDTWVFGDAVTLQPSGNGMYPVLAALPDAVIAAWTGGVHGASVIHVRRIAH
jgi:hypothetical protein